MKDPMFYCPFCGQKHKGVEMRGNRHRLVDHAWHGAVGSKCAGSSVVLLPPDETDPQPPYVVSVYDASRYAVRRPDYSYVAICDSINDAHRIAKALIATEKPEEPESKPAEPEKRFHVEHNHTWRVMDGNVLFASSLHEANTTLIVDALNEKAAREKAMASKPKYKAAEYGSEWRVLRVGDPLNCYVADVADMHYVARCGTGPIGAAEAKMIADALSAYDQ
jgi:hypothetical protein